MILDALAVFADAQSGTTSVASTDIIDTLAAGNSYEGCWFVFRVDTAFTQINTASRATIQLQTSSDSAWGGDGYTLVASVAFTTAQLAANKMWAVRIPAGTKRYIRGYKSVSGTDANNAFSGGAWDMFIVKDFDVEINRRYMIPC